MPQILNFHVKGTSWQAAWNFFVLKQVPVPEMFCGVRNLTCLYSLNVIKPHWDSSKLWAQFRGKNAIVYHSLLLYNGILNQGKFILNSMMASQRYQIEFGAQLYNMITHKTFVWNKVLQTILMPDKIATSWLMKSNTNYNLWILICVCVLNVAHQNENFGSKLAEPSMCRLLWMTPLTVGGSRHPQLRKWSGP